MIQILLVYLDDILVFSETFDEHLDRLETVLKRLAKTSRKLKLELCLSSGHSEVLGASSVC